MEGDGTCMYMCGYEELINDNQNTTSDNNNNIYTYNIFAAGCDNQFLDSASDGPKSIRVDLRHIPRMQPPFGVDRLLCFVPHLHVAHHDVTAIHAELVHVGGLLRLDTRDLL